jgi:hypothetical protein
MVGIYRFSSEQTKRNILGGKAKRFFNLDPVVSEVEVKLNAAP